MTDATYEIAICGWRARISGPPSLLRNVKTLFPGGYDGERSPVATHFEIVGNRDHPGRLQILRDKVVTREINSEAELIPVLELLTAAAIDGLAQRSYYLFHAAAIACAGQALIAPAASGTGKTSLTLGLMQSGFRCFTDEVTIIDPSSFSVSAFRKSMCVKATTRAAIAGIMPEQLQQGPWLRPSGEQVWYVSPPETAWASVVAPVGWVVLPRHTPGQPGRVTRLPRSAALVRLMEQTFTIEVRRPPAFGRVLDMLRQAECYELQYGSLDEAVRLVSNLVQR